MEGESILPSPVIISPTLDPGRAYNATDAAAILGITPYVLNERVREGLIKPIFETGDRRYSGYVLAQILGWPPWRQSRGRSPCCCASYGQLSLPSEAAGSCVPLRGVCAAVGRVRIVASSAQPTSGLSFPGGP